MFGVAYAGPSLRPARLPTRWMNELELASILSEGNTRVNLREVEDRIMPMLSSLPQNQSGYVRQEVARYALVRYFLVYRGWHMKGLAKDGAVWNAPTVSARTSRYPVMLLRLIMKILRTPLIGIKDFVRVVAAVETLVYDNVKEILMLAYGTSNLSVEEPLSGPDQEELVLKTFAMFLIQPHTQRAIGNQSVEEYWNDLRNSSTSPLYWDHVDLWVSDTSQAAKRALTKPFSKDMDFASMLAIAEAINSGFVGHSQLGCRSMKHHLMDANGTENGSVPLASFYQASSTSEWFKFTESPKYLEFIDALDVRTPHRDQVLIPNYVMAAGNCGATATYYQVCCISECEFLLARLEAAVRKPYVSPDALLEVVADLASDTVRAPRNLSASLQDRLYEISRMNDAAVPLHGRMFSEWMHRAFPNECPMPASKRLRTGGFKGEDRFVSRWEIGDIVRAELQSNHTDNKTMDRFFEKVGSGDGFQMPWSEVEEVLIYQDFGEFLATEEQKAAAAADDSSDSSTVRASLRPAVAAVTVTTFLVAGIARYLDISVSKPRAKLGRREV